MRKQLLIYIIAIFGFAGSINAQTFPVSSSIVMPFPHPIFLSDYSDPMSNSMQVTLRLNDHSISSLNVKLKIILDNGNVTLSTKDNYIPSSIITLTPGMPVILKGSDLYDALKLNNMNLNGISASYLNQNGGKLPEGQYTFCVKVLDTKLNKEISSESCNVVFLQTQQPPTLLTPECGAYIMPATPQQIMINWQVSGGGAPNYAGMNTFTLEMYEVTVQSSNPANAVLNSQAVKVYESNPTTLNNFNLDFSTVLLVAGKQYVYRVRGMGPNDKQVFENDGYSQWCWFNYGYPTGGSIELDQPFDKKQFKKTDQKVFAWGVSDKGVDNQSYDYKIKIVPQEDTTETYDATLLNGTAFHEETLATTSSTDGSNFLLNKELIPDKKYIWVIEAYSENQKVASSTPQSFYSHSLIENFYASNREIKVIQITNPDLDDLAGKARINLSEDEEDFVDVNFTHLKIKDVSGQKILTDGEIIFDLSSRDQMELEPTIESNGPAMFEYVNGVIDKDGLKVQGKMRWKIPHAVLPNENEEVITTISTYVMDSDGKLSGEAAIEPFSTILIAPKDFQLKLKETCLLQLSKNKFEVQLVGSILLSTDIKTLNSQPIKIEFKDYVNQLDYIEIDNLIGKVSAGVAPLNNFKMEFIPLAGGVIDLSEDESPGKLAADKGWKGFYITEYKIRLHSTDLDESNQLKIPSIIDHNLTTEGTSNKFWISGAGLTLKTDINLVEDEGVTFNTFPAKTIGKIEFKKSSLKEAIFEGTINIPFVGDDEKFKFEIGATVEGLEEGFLNEDLTERELTFNPFGVENKMNVKINRAVFENNEWISMNLEVEIPEVGATLEAIENFRVYGDNFVGVEGKNKSKTLDNFVVGKFKNLDLSITEFGAAYLGGSYALSYSAETSLSEGFSGEDGPPILAISSVMKTSAEPGPDASIPVPDIEVPEGLEDETAVKPAGISLVIETAIVDGDAKLLFTANDPKWGTKFEGGINVKVKIPMAINFGTNLTLGITKEKMDYWYFDAYFEDKSSTGIPVYEPITLILTGNMVKLFNITGMEGKIFRHMRGTQDDKGKFSLDLAPDVMFGMGLYAQIIDGDARGFIFQADLGIEAEMTGKGFIPEAMKLSMSGEAAFLNFNIRTGVSLKQVVAEVAPAVVEEVVNLTAGAIFPIDFDIDGTNYKVNSTGFDNGSLAIGNYDSGNGFKIGANVSKKPSAEIGFAKDGFKAGIKADASGSGAFDFIVGDVKLVAKMDKMNSAAFDLKISDLATNFGGDIKLKKANFGFSYEKTKLKLDVDAPKKKGLIEVAIADVKFHAATTIPDKYASIGFEIESNKFDMSYHGVDKKASLLADIAGIELRTSFDIQKKTGTLYLETSSDLISIKASDKLADFRLEAGSNIIAFKSNFAKETGSVNLTFPNNQLKGEITEKQAEIFLKHDDFEIGLMGKYDATKGGIHLKEGDFLMDFGADIKEKSAYMALAKGSNSFASRYNLKDSSFVRYKTSTTSSEVSIISNTYKTRFKDSDKEILLQTNPNNKSGRMLFAIPSFSFDGNFNATAKTASLEIEKGDVKLKNYIINDSAVIDYNIGSKKYRVAGSNGGSGSVYFKDSDAGIATGFGFDKQQKAGSLIFQNGDLLIDIAANKTLNTGKIIVEKGSTKFHAIIADSALLMTEVDGTTFSAVKNTNKTSVFFGDDNNQIGLSKLSNGGTVFLKSGDSEIDLSKIASDYSANFTDGSLNILTELSPTQSKIDFTKDALAISTTVSTSSAFDFTYGDGSTNTNIGGNIESGIYNLAVDAGGWSGSINENFTDRSTVLNLSNSDATLGISYLTNTKSISLGLNDFAITGGVDQGSAFMKSTYNDVVFNMHQTAGVSLAMGSASANFTNITAKQFDLGLAFDNHNILIKQIPLDGKPSLDLTINGTKINAQPSDFSFTVNEGDWQGSVTTVFDKKSAEISIANSDYALDMMYKENNKYLTFAKGTSSLAGGLKKSKGYFKASHDKYSVELEDNTVAIKTDIANLELSNFQNNMCDIEAKFGGKTLTLIPSLVSGKYSLAASLDNNNVEISADKLSIGIDEGGYEGTFISKLTSNQNILNITKGDYAIESTFSSDNQVLELSYNDFTVSGGVKNNTKYFTAGYQDLKVEVDENSTEFDFDGSKVEINNITSTQFDVEFLLGSKNFVITPTTAANGYELIAKVNGNPLNLITAYDTLISGTAVHIDKDSDNQYELKLTKNGKSLKVEFEENKVPELAVQNGSDTYLYTITDDAVNVVVNNYTADYQTANDELTILQGSNNSFKVSEEALAVVFGSTKVNISETAVSVEEGNLLINGTEDQIALNTIIKGKNVDIIAKKTGELSTAIIGEGLAIATEYISGEYPKVKIDESAVEYIYQFTDNEILVEASGVEAKFNKLDKILEITQNNTNEFKVSENLLALKLDNIEFEATPQSFQLDKGDLSTYIDNSTVRIKQKLGANKIKVELAKDGDNTVELAIGNQFLNVDYVANEIPEVTYKNGGDEYGYKISDESVTIIAQDYSAKYTSSDNKIEISQGANNTFALSPTELSTSIEGYNLTANKDSLSASKGNFKTSFSAESVSIEVDDKLLAINKDKSITLAIAAGQSISATQNSIELNYNSNKLKVSDSELSVVQVDQNISGTITATGASLSKGDYALTATNDNLKFEHGADNLNVSQSAISGKYDKSEFSITQDKTISYSDDARSHSVSEQSLAMTQDGIGLTVLADKVKVNINNSGEIIASKELLSYNNDGFTLALDKPFTSPDFTYNYQENSLKLSATALSIGVGDIGMSVGKNTLLVKLDDSHSLGIIMAI